MIRFIDWFAGIAGFRLGLERCNHVVGDIESTLPSIYGKQNGQVAQRGKAIDNARVSNAERGLQQRLCFGIPRDKFVCVGACDNDRYARRIYAKHFGHEPEWGDSKEVSTNSLPTFDVFCAGFPCQSFSIAGRRGGLLDARGTLFGEICRILGDTQPPYFILENVKGLLSAPYVDSQGKKLPGSNGRVFLRILFSLGELGYDVQWQVLNSKNFGVPQNRERVFFVGHLRGRPRPQIFPLESTYTQALAQSIGIGGGHSSFAAMTERRTEEAKAIRRQIMQSQGKDWCPRRDKELVPRQDGMANTLTAGQSKEHLLSDGISLRQLTPLECERLQGFPDGWTEGISDAQRYKCLGNAVTVNVVHAIGERFAQEVTL